MLEFTPKPSFRLTPDGIVGTWEAYKGDGIHGWRRQAYVFRREDGWLVMESWLPNPGEGQQPLHQVATERLRVEQTLHGLLLIEQGSDPWTYELRPVGEASFVRIIPGTSAGLVYFRRTRTPPAEL